MTSKPVTNLCHQIALTLSIPLRTLLLLGVLNLAAPLQANQPLPPKAPSNLTATAVSTSQINLRWQDNSGDESGFIIERAASSSGPWAQITTVGVNIIAYSNTGLSAAKTYYYRALAYSKWGNSSYTPVAITTTLAPADITAPSVPSGLTAWTASSSQINLSWSPSTDTGGSGLAGYKVFRSGVQIGTTASTSYSSAGLAAGTTYCYSVAAYDGTGNTSAQGAQTCATTSTTADITAPSVPSGLTAWTASSSQINLSWSPSTDTGGSGLAGYKVFRSGVQIGTTASTSYSSAGLAAGTTYCYSVAAYDGTGNTSAQGAQTCATTSTTADITAPSVPSGLTAWTASSSQINLSWSPSTDTGGSGLAGYKVFRSGVQIGTTASTSYSSAGLAASTTYCYSVAAYDGTGNTSAQSAQTCATTSTAADITAPSVPSGLTAWTASSSQINLSWSPSTDTGGSGLAGYKVFRSGVQIGTTASTSYSSAGLAAGTTYCYSVAAYDGTGNTSAQGAQTCATTSTAADITAPSVPSGLTAWTASSSQINLSWSPSTDTGGSGLAGYKVFRSGVQIGTTASTSYSSAGLAAGTTYCYSVAAYDGTGNTSAQGAQTCATTSTTADITAPSVPSGLTAWTASSSQINLSWSPSTDTGGSGLAGYKVFRSGVQIGSTASTSYSSAGLAASTTYCYSVVAYDGAGNTSAQGAQTCATTSTTADITAPSVPSGLTAWTASSSQINLSWSPSTDTGGSGLAGYKVFRSGVQIGSTASTSYSSAGLAASTTYCYSVVAYDGAGNTSAQGAQTCATTSTAADITAPSVPSGLTAWTASSSQINLSWSPSTDTGGSGLAGYKVFRSGVQIGSTASTSYSSAGLAASTTYCYSVVAYDGAGNTSAQGAQTCATTSTTADITAPSVPSGLTATTASSSQINLSWSPSTDTGGSGLAGYKVFRSGVQIGSTASTSYSSAGLAAGTTYCYSVAAYDGVGNTSAQTAQTCATTSTAADITAPSVPSGLTATTASSSQINLSWSPSTDTGGSGLAGYKVFRSGVQIGTTASTSYSSAGLAAGTTYCYSVAAYDGTGNTSAQGAQSCATTSTAADITAPSVPSVLTAATASSSQINLTWSPSTDTGGSGLAGYKVFRSGVQIGTTASTSYSSAGLAAGTTYCYSVAAYDGVGNTSAQTAQTCATTPAASDITAPLVTLTAPTSGSTVSGTITLSATASDNVGVTKVEFYRDGTILLGSDTTSSYSIALDTATLPNGSHSFYCKAYDAAGNSSTSATSIVTVSNTIASLTGTCIWSQRFGGTDASGDNAYPAAIQEDHRGDVVVAGAFQKSINFGGGSLTAVPSGNNGTDAFLAKYSGSTGAHLWSLRMGGANVDGATGVAIDSGNNVVVVGTYTGTIDFTGTTLTSAGSADIFVAKYSTDGTLMWVKRFGGTAGEKCQGVTIDRADNILITGGYGFYGTAVDFGGGPLPLSGGPSAFQYDMFVAKLSPSGGHIWSRGFGGLGYDLGNAIAVDSNGDVAVVGEFQQTSSFGGANLTSLGGYDVFVAKYSGANGSHLWSRSGGGTGNESGKAVACDPNGNVVATGEFIGTANFGGNAMVSANGLTGMFLAKYAPGTGAHIWSRGFSATGPTGTVSGRGIATDSLGNVVVTGGVAGNAIFDGIYLGFGNPAVMMVKFSENGSTIWAKFYDGPQDDGGTAVTVGASDRILATGSFPTSVDFGGGPMSSPGGYDGFVVKLTP